MNWLKIICQEHGISMYKLSQITSIPRTTIQEFNNRYINELKLGDCELIANALGMKAIDFIIKYYPKYKVEVNND
ncbi:helix-turn-helix transcriptional regulator (plasmid) [Mycoplasmatota bacterium]|nr:helix-turn-helix transcriptional regulator [Mycoplasmatota bacterium]